jgi:hypothetical protein
VIQELADQAGSYIIVSSHGSTSNSVLGNRRNALREALDGGANANQLHTDFYERTLLAPWAYAATPASVFKMGTRTP